MSSHPLDKLFNGHFYQEKPPEPKFVFILAYNHPQADRYASDKQWPRNRWKYISQLRDELRGIRGEGMEVHLLHDWTRNGRYDTPRIHAELRWCRERGVNIVRVPADGDIRRRNYEGS